jgi:hypothetical protein
VAIAVEVPDAPDPVNVTGGPPVGTDNDARAMGAPSADAQMTATATIRCPRTALPIDNA